MKHPAFGLYEQPKARKYTYLHFGMTLCLTQFFNFVYASRAREKYPLEYFMRQPKEYVS